MNLLSRRFPSNTTRITEIEYRGQAYSFTYKNKSLHIGKKQSNDYPLPQIIYVPAERNIIANVPNAGK
jgi:hypothetical protein